MLKEIKYNNEPLQSGHSRKAKLAHIDSAGPLIQMPMSEFKQLTNYLKEIDPSVRWAHNTEEEGYRLVTDRSCDDIHHKYGDLEFFINET
jgi:hypothetical protein